MFLYVVYDKVAQEASPPFCAKNDGVALRSYQAMMKDVTTDHAEYSLLRVATYVPEPVSVEGINPPEEVMVALAEEVR